MWHILNLLWIWYSLTASGDGANDVNMIQAADIGIGISGQEGMQVWTEVLSLENVNVSSAALSV